MKTYSTFHFSSYDWNHHAGKVTLRYSLDNEEDFEETILLPEPISDAHLKAHEWQLERLLFALHIIGGISYYKTCLPKTISVESGILSKQEAGFWNLVYEHGLGEFFFRNNIDYRGLIKFPSNDDISDAKKFTAKHRVSAMTAAYQPRPIKGQRILVPIGGGKDSMVTMNLLQKAGAHVTLLRLGHHPIIDELADTAGLPLLNVKRTLSGNLFDLNAQGALNGHVPITAYLSVLSLLIAELYGFDAVVMSNERSANIGNVEFKGMEINHQWSKSVEFEKALRTYVSDSIETNTQYFSLLRPYSELKIAELFSEMPAYLEKATSCNKNWKILADEEEAVRWCGTCPKCTFVFTILAAYVKTPVLKKIFGKNLFDDAALVPLYKELLGVQNFKPFECVGTKEETQAAFLLALKKNPDQKTSPVMQMFINEVEPTIAHPTSLIDQCLKSTAEHCIPKEFQMILPSL